MKRLKRALFLALAAGGALAVGLSAYAVAQTYILRRPIAGLTAGAAADIALPTCGAGQKLTSDGTQLSCVTDAAQVLLCEHNFNESNSNWYGTYNFTSGECGGSLPDSNYVMSMAGATGSCADLQQAWDNGGGAVHLLFTRCCCAGVQIRVAFTRKAQ